MSGAWIAVIVGAWLVVTFALAVVVGRLAGLNERAELRERYHPAHKRSEGGDDVEEGGTGAGDRGRRAAPHRAT